MQRILVISGLLSTLAIYAADAERSLLEIKKQLKKQLVVSIQRQPDGAIFTYDLELQDMVACMEPVKTLISQAESAEQCELIQQKLNFAKVVIRNSSVFTHGGDRRTVYHEIIPAIFALPELSSPDDLNFYTASWRLTHSYIIANRTSSAFPPRQLNHDECREPHAC